MRNLQRIRWSGRASLL